MLITLGVYVVPSSLASRPYWFPNLERVFNKMKRDFVDNTCKSDEMAINYDETGIVVNKVMMMYMAPKKWCRRLLPSYLHKCHVFPWAAIDALVDKLSKPQNAADLLEFVKLLFEYDSDAKVPTKWGEQGLIVKRDNGVIDEFIIPQDYAKQLDFITNHYNSLKTLNSKYLNAATVTCDNAANNIQKAKNLKLCKGNLFNSPANLRLGSGDINSKIGDNMDLMGYIFGLDSSASATYKETQLLGTYRTLYAINVDLRSPYCFIEKNELKILSSTSYSTYVIWPNAIRDLLPKEYANCTRI